MDYYDILPFENFTDYDFFPAVVYSPSFEVLFDIVGTLLGLCLYILAAIDNYSRLNEDWNSKLVFGSLIIPLFPMILKVIMHTLHYIIVFNTFLLTVISICILGDELANIMTLILGLDRLLKTYKGFKHRKLLTGVLLGLCVIFWFIQDELYFSSRSIVHEINLFLVLTFNIVVFVNLFGRLHLEDTVNVNVRIDKVILFFLLSQLSFRFYLVHVEAYRRYLDSIHMPHYEHLVLHISNPLVYILLVRNPNRICDQLFFPWMTSRDNYDSITP